LFRSYNFGTELKRFWHIYLLSNGTVYLYLLPGVTASTKGFR